MSFRSALDRLLVVQESVAITSPEITSIKKAWKYVPPQSVILPEVPAIFNTWTLAEEQRRVSLRILRYIVNMQLAVLNANIERGADIVTALVEDLIDKLDADVTLNGNATRTDLRGADPTLVMIERGGAHYIGANLFLDVEIKSAKEYGP